MIPPYIKTTPEGVRLSVKVQPNASRNEVVGEHGGMLKVKIAAIPEGGRANTELVEFMAEVAGLRKADVELVGGPGSRQKVLLLRNTTAEQVHAALEAARA